MFIICAIWFVVGFGVAYLWITTTIQIDQEWLEGVQRDYLECGNAVGIAEGVMGEYMDSDEMYDICKGVIESPPVIVCVDCDRV